MDRPPHLDIDLNEAPSPCDAPPAVPPSPLREVVPPISAPPPPPPPPRPPPPPANPQLLLPHEARELALRFHQAQLLRDTAARAIASVAAGVPLGAPPPAQHPGEAGWGHSPRSCASCGRPEILGGTIVCDACERGFHLACVSVWPPLMPQPPPPPPGPSGARRPRAAANEDWMCPECEMRGARTNRWRLADLREDPIAVAVRDVSRINVADGAHWTEFAMQLPHFEGLHLKNTSLYDGNQFMPTFILAHCLSMR